MDRFSIAGFGGWLLACVGGLAALGHYAATPGPVRIETGAGRSDLRAPPGKLRLVMFLHPLCPCSRASLEELSVLLAHVGGRGRLEAEVLFIRLRQPPDGWESSGLRRQASALPGVKSGDDLEGLAEKLGARTSGDTVVVDDRGTVLYRGGLTVARGHLGENDGLVAVEAVAAGREPAVRNGPVYGCELETPDDAAKGAAWR